MQPVAQWSSPRDWLERTTMPHVLMDNRAIKTDGRGYCRCKHSGFNAYICRLYETVEFIGLGIIYKYMNIHTYTLDGSANPFT